jgi:hypothetical protein
MVNDLTYVLPLRVAAPATEELTTYIRAISRLVPVIIVDGSGPSVFDEHHRAWHDVATHVPPRVPTPNGKVGGVLTGLDHAATTFVVIADDDVRYDEHGLAALRRAMGSVAAVVPQNYFDPLPWHARWDTARTLLNRLAGGDFPGTIGVDRRFVLDMGGYDGSVLFENLELLRSIEAAGGVWQRADLMVRRAPPTPRRFVEQRVRQAYDEFARPVRLAAALSLAPSWMLLGRRSRVVAVATTVLLAEAGRRRGSARTCIPWTCSLFAPAWVAERAICCWLAVGSRLRGGARYGAGRLPVAANPLRTIRQRQQGTRRQRPDTVTDQLPATAHLEGAHRHDHPQLTLA